MMQKKLGLFILVVIVLAISGCGMQNVEISQPSQTPVVVTQLVTVVVVVTATPEVQSVDVIQQTFLDSSESTLWVSPIEAENHVGRKIIVRVDSAQCSYQASLTGSPTFCNDSPYPNHSFTFLVWEEDWSYLDQECVVVEGLVELYQGKPQIEVSSPDQITICEK
jgi:hypothetical protein